MSVESSLNFIAPGATIAAPAQRPAAPTPVKLDDQPRRLPSHIPALDGIRGLAVLLVLLCHATQRPFFGMSSPLDQILSALPDRLVLAVARVGWTGVDLFFVLSGFLITGILFDAKGKQYFFRNFYARRTVRIFPLYYATLILFLVIWPMLPAGFSRGFGQTTTSTVWYWLYTSNFSQAVAEQAGHPMEHPLQVAWSLSIEEQFYLCWPLIVFLFDRKTVVRICLGMFFGAMAFRIAMLSMGLQFYGMSFTFGRVDGLAVGAAIALIARGPLGINCLVKPAKWLAPISAIGLATLIVGMKKLGYHLGMGQSPGYVICGTALFSLLYGSVLVLTVAAAEGALLNRLFTNPVLKTYGKYSYAVYLLHMPIIILVAEYVFNPIQLRIGGSLVAGLFVFDLITWSLALLAAIVSWNVLEKHFLKLKDYFPMEKKAALAAHDRAANP
jgi:peptidoglycan/LPS O-acetylase OafA/YrhL